ncbi:hypothetical protein I7I53_07525 [Histoplasma capsulatum var. duboisii H88]|uniref:Uncharacterized protein n=1 Tax=Ajellomyces capsulatus (strain H88) TaxID=544711 RepID=A0A8A1LJM5_AJEC8|nr:hypothetical protein I7I53_07525 [Histoplasma capsulatum var. duboisii H88]
MIRNSNRNYLAESMNMRDITLFHSSDATTAPISTGHVPLLITSTVGSQMYFCCCNLISLWLFVLSETYE